MRKLLYFECNSGISGDMTVAALLDLGADQEKLKAALDSLPVKGFRYEIKRVKKAGLDACDFSVILGADHENHDHDMAYLHGPAGEVHIHEHTDSDHSHDHSHECHGQEHTGHDHEHTDHPHGHSHGHGDEGRGHEHKHEHRNLNDILHIISHADLTPGARSLAERIFMILGRAEAKAHGVGLEEVHFHEVGAVDSIVDIVAAAVCLDNLGIRETVVPVLCEGTGTVRCQHGILPVPVPATANIVEESGLKMQIMDMKGEFVTPTGAAIAAAVKTEDRLPEAFCIKKIGLGAGKRSYERPSLLRVMILEAEERTQKDRIVKLETNVDDCTGENLGYVMERLMQAGARDVHYTPVYMKKNRPAYQINVICDREHVSEMEAILFAETTTIGIRRAEMERTVLKREMLTVETAFGKALVKVCRTMDGKTNYYPEYESVAQLCREHGVPFGEMYRTVLKSVSDGQTA